MAVKKSQQISREFHEKVVDEFTKRMITLEERIAERDKLIGMMHISHERDITIAAILRKKVIAMKAIIDCFTNTFEAFKQTAINDSPEAYEFDKTSQKNANEIQGLIFKIEQEKYSHGAIASQVAVAPSDDAKALIRKHVEQYRN